MRLYNINPVSLVCAFCGNSFTGRINKKYCSIKCGRSAKSRRVPQEQKDRAMRKWALKNKYGITEEVYERLVKAQDGKCAICGDPLEGKRFPIDHNHTTQKVRGLLCRRCNVGLGQFKDNINILLAAIEYLKRDK